MKLFQHRFLKNRKELILIAVVLLIVFSGGVIVLKHKRQNSPALASQVTIPTKPPLPSTVTTLLDAVSQKTAVPQDETPDVATVTDVSKLQDQLFFQKAQNGDKVLMYLTSKKAILYRPSTQTIILIAPLEIISKNASGSAEGDFAASDSAIMTISPSATISGPVLRVEL